MKGSIQKDLNEQLLQQDFAEKEKATMSLQRGQQLAQLYAETENALIVLSDLTADCSYIYYGGMADTLGLKAENDQTEIPSIWEKEVLDRVHPDDLLEKYKMELYFFHFLKTVPLDKRKDYHVTSRVRMRNVKGEYFAVWHRIFYLDSMLNGSVGLVLCMYSLSFPPGMQDLYEGQVVHTKTGAVIKTHGQQEHTILSHREHEILSLIKNGKQSREIAEELSISLHTVNRHRQNILEKLQVSNSIEACYKAVYLGWLS